jgi:transcriptional regulator with XRE-family HTH domain
MEAMLPGMNTPGPGLRRRQLGKALELLREAAGKSQADAAAVLECARSQISHFESGTRVPRKPDLPALMTLYGAGDTVAAELEQLRQQANTRGWWAAHHLPPWMQHYLSLESDASTIRCFVLELVPGLVQTADYARETYLRHGTDPADVGRYVAARMERQRRVGTEQQVTLVASEALLHRTRAMGDVGIGQLRSLASACGMQGVTIQVLPFDVGGHVSMAGSFTLFDYPEQLIDPVAYLEYAGGGHLTDDPVVITNLEWMYSQVAAQALNTEDSEAIIRRWASFGG